VGEGSGPPPAGAIRRRIGLAAAEVPESWVAAPGIVLHSSFVRVGSISAIGPR